jgi:hypothetical protein
MLPVQPAWPGNARALGHSPSEIAGIAANWAAAAVIDVNGWPPVLRRLTVDCTSPLIVSRRRRADRDRRADDRDQFLA